jgi:hypothetical protein
MKSVHRPIRIEPAFEDREAVRAMFARHAPYRAIGAYIPDVVVDDATKPKPNSQFNPGSEETGRRVASPSSRAPKRFCATSNFLRRRRPSSERRVCFRNLLWSMSMRRCLPA